jgi:hypothetical protein
MSVRGSRRFQSIYPVELLSSPDTRARSASPAEQPLEPEASEAQAAAAMANIRRKPVRSFFFLILKYRFEIESSFFN